MTTVYVVCKIGFEYNDEIYSSGETDSVETLVKGYHTKAAAQKEADALNLKEFRDTEIEQYCYSINEIFPPKGRHTPDMGDYDFEEGEDITAFIKNASDEDVVKLINLMTLKFYEVREVKLVD